MIAQGICVVGIKVCAREYGLKKVVVKVVFKEMVL
jgi:hypothetical protein